MLVYRGYLTCIETSNLTSWVEQREESLLQNNSYCWQAGGSESVASGFLTADDYEQQRRLGGSFLHQASISGE